MNTITPVLSMAPAARAIVIAISAVLVAITFGGGSFGAGRADAAAALELAGACEPDAVRPNEPVLVSCTVTLTNSGDEAATDLNGTVFIADGCSIPSRFSFLDRTLNGDLMPPLGLSFAVPDLGPGETMTQVSRIATENWTPGPTGGSVTITSADDRAVSATIDLCWDVSGDAAAPPSELAVSKTTLTEPDVIVIQEPVAPPPPDDGAPLPVEPAIPPGAEHAEFEILITNVSDAPVADVTLLDVPTGDAVFESADPAATGSDALGRPYWDVGILAPGEAFRVTATYGPPAGGNCSYADDVAVVSATLEGGPRQDYVAFSDFSVPVGPCEFIGPDYCWHYPPEGEPTIAPCDFEVCWAAPPDGTGFRPVYDCEPDVEYCWFLPPGEGYTALRPCSDEVCWLSFGPAEFEDFYDVPCDIEFCQFTAPDGSTSTTGECSFPVCWSSVPGSGEWRQVWDCGQFGDQCWFLPPGDGYPTLRGCSEEVCWLPLGPGDFLYDVPCEFGYCEFTAPDGITSTPGDCSYPVCWSSPPEGGYWEQVYDCGEFEDWCWFSLPEGESRSALSSCDFPLRFAVNPPEGAVDFGFGPQPVYGEGEWCWPVPPDAEEFVTFPTPCEEIDSIYWFTPDDGSPATPSFGTPETCLQPPPPELVSSPDIDLPPDLLIPGPCAPDEEPQAGIPGSSIPVETVEGVSSPAEVVEGPVETIEALPSEAVSPAELVEGTVTVLDPVPSSDVIPADVVPTDRSEPAPDGPRDVALPIEDIDGPTAEPDPRDGTDADESSGPAANVTTLPDAGSGAASPHAGSTWLAAGALVAGVLLSGAALRLRRRGL